MQIKEKSSILLIIFYSIVAILIGVVLFQNFTSKSNLESTSDETEEAVQINQFGFEDSDLTESLYEVKRNQTLSDIFSGFELGKFSFEEIINTANKIFDVRSLRTGKSYHAYLSDDSLSQLKYFVYQKDPINYVVFSLNDSLQVYNGQKEVSVKQNIKASEITNSLYVSLLEENASPELAMKLSQIFAWQIDFYGIQKGDRFKVIYDEEYVGDKLIGVGNIIGAYFLHKGEEFWAIPFEQDSVYQFFDHQGNSLRKAFLKAPLEFSRISSRYTKKRFHPVLRRSKPHLGTDYAAPHGTPIRTVGDGIVLEAGYSGGNGNYVKVKHNSIYTTQYLHMSKFAKGIKKGVRVSQGQTIGYVGATGLATGPHLCYRFWKNGVQVDPFREKIPPSHPVKRELLPEFEKTKIDVMGKLGKINFKDKVKDAA